MPHRCKHLGIDAALWSVCEEVGKITRPDAYRERSHAGFYRQSLAESYIILCTIALQQRPARQQGMQKLDEGDTGKRPTFSVTQYENSCVG